MIDGMFQITGGKNAVGLNNLARKSDLDGSTIFLRTGLGWLGWNKLDGRNFNSKLLIPAMSVKVLLFRPGKEFGNHRHFT